MPTLKKGTCVRAEWFGAPPLGATSLSGVQMKVSAKPNVVQGTVAHIRGDHPVSPTSIPNIKG